MVQKKAPICQSSDLKQHNTSDGTPQENNGQTTNLDVGPAFHEYTLWLHSPADLKQHHCLQNTRIRLSFGRGAAPKHVHKHGKLGFALFDTAVDNSGPLANLLGVDMHATRLIY